MQKESQADKIHARRFHYKMLTRASVFKNFFKPSCVVAHLHVKDITEVVLVTNIERGVRYINAGAKRFCFQAVSLAVAITVWCGQFIFSFKAAIIRAFISNGHAQSACTLVIKFRSRNRCAIQIWWWIASQLKWQANLSCCETFGASHWQSFLW